MDKMRGAPAKAAESATAERQTAPKAKVDARHDTRPGALLADARELLSIARRGSRKLVTGGINWNSVTALPHRIALIEKAQKAWEKQRARTTPSAFHRTRDEAAQLKTEMLAAGRYVLRHDAMAQSRLDVIAVGEGIDDLVSDLRALADFWSRRSSQLARTELAPDVVLRARTLAAQLDIAYHRMQETQTSGSSPTQRGGRFARLGEAVDDLRSVLREAPERLTVFRYEFEHLKPQVERPKKRRG